MQKQYLLRLKKFGKVMMWIGTILIMIMLLFTITVCVFRSINKNQIKITNPKGIQENVFVEIGDIKQYIQIRGENKENPIVLFLHGGPGSPMAYMSYYFQQELEKDYTFIHWDQRGCGRTYYANPDMDFNQQLSADILLSDIDEIIDYLKERFDQDIIIMGHSWGTVLGSSYALKHPEKIAAYIAVAQVIDFKQGNIIAVEKAIETAKENKDSQSAQEFTNALTEYKNSENYETFNMNNYVKMRILTQKHLTFDGSMNILQQMWLGLTSSEFSFDDLKWFMKMSDAEEAIALQRPLTEPLFFEYNIYQLELEYKIPVYFISGYNDWITPNSLLEEYYDKIDAPSKQLTYIDYAGHTPFMENRDAFSDAFHHAVQNAFALYQ